MRHLPAIVVLGALAGCDSLFNLEPVDDIEHGLGPDGSVVAPDADLTGDGGTTSTAGTFFRSYDSVGFTDKSFPATVSALELDAHEVTVARFRAFVSAGWPTPAAGAGAHAKISGSGWDAAWPSSATAAALKCDASYQTWTDAAGANEQKPINCVTWYEAFAFCIWDGGYLPTEAEWNYVAAGGDEQRVYPWSNPPNSTTIDCTYANHNASCGVLGPRNVGSTPNGVGRWGQVDLAGNVAEWNLDGFNSYLTPCVDCANLTDIAARIYRGSHFGGIPSQLRVGSRVGLAPGDRNAGIGVRCARSM